MRMNAGRRGLGANIKGMRDEVADPLTHESLMGADPTRDAQVAAGTTDMQVNAPKGLVNPVMGKGSAMTKLKNSSPTTTQANATRPNPLTGTNSPAAKGRGMRMKLRRAFGAATPSQSGNSTGDGIKPVAGKQTPFVTNAGHNKNKFAATPSNTSIPPTRR